MSSHRASRRIRARHTVGSRRTIGATFVVALAAAAVTLAGLGVVGVGPTGVIPLAGPSTGGVTGHGTGSGPGGVSSLAGSSGLSGHSSPHAAQSSRAGAGGLRATGAATAAQLRGRQRAVSRDSTRVARREDTSKDLQAAAERDAKVRAAALAQLARGAHRQAHRIATAWQLPVTRGVYHLTARFGSCSGLWSHCHTGLDFAAPTGTPIHAVASGRIIETSYAGAYGNRTIMKLPDGIELWYCHQTAYLVHVGEKVTAGQVIGLVGSTGNTTGPHVHLEVRPNPKTPIDPFAALVAHGVHP